MAAYQSPVRRFSADFLSDKENTPSKEVNRLKSLLKSQAQVADTSTNSDADPCAIHQTDQANNGKVMVKLKDGTMIKLCKSCATSNIIEENSQKPPKRQRKPRAKVEKESKASDKKAANKNESLENSAENESTGAKPKATKTARANKNKANTTASKALIEKNTNVEQQVDANRETKPAAKKTAVKPKRATKKAQKPEDTTKTQEEINNTANENVSMATADNITADQTLHERQDTSVNDDNQGNVEKPAKKTRQRKGKKNSVDADKNQDQLNEKNTTIDNNNSQSSESQNKSDTINNTLEKATKAKRGKRNNNSTLQKQAKLNNSIGQINANSFKETEEPSSSSVPKQINNISTHDSSSHDMEGHSTSLEDNHPTNMSIHQNETIKNIQSMQGKDQASDNHDKLDTNNNIVEENVTKRHGGNKNKKETADKKKKKMNDSKKKDQVEQPGNSTIEERNDNVSTDDPSFNNNQVHSTSLEDNVNTNIHKDETLKINQLMLASSFVTTRIKKEPADDDENNAKSHANMFETPKKPVQYQLMVKAPVESPKKKCKSKKMEQSNAAASCSFKKGKTEEKEKLKYSCKRQKKKSSENKKKLDRERKTVVKVAKAMEKMSHYYAKSKLGKMVTESDLSTTESESSSSECSSSCSCYSESSSGDDCRCWNCLMQDDSDDSSWSETSEDESDESNTSDSSSSSSGTCEYERNKRRACKRYNLRKR